MTKKKKKLKTLISTDDRGLRIELIGYNDPSYIPYIRLEDSDGTYMGVIKDKDLSTIKKFAEIALKAIK